MAQLKKNSQPFHKHLNKKDYFGIWIMWDYRSMQLYRFIIANYSGHVSSILLSGNSGEFAQQTCRTRDKIKNSKWRREISSMLITLNSTIFRPLFCLIRHLESSARHYLVLIALRGLFLGEGPTMWVKIFNNMIIL